MTIDEAVRAVNAAGLRLHALKDIGENGSGLWYAWVGLKGCFDPDRRNYSRGLMDPAGDPAEAIMAAMTAFLSDTDWNEPEEVTTE